MTSPATTERLLTEDEFLAMPSDPEGRKRELLDGRVICLSHPGVDHGRAARAIMLALAYFAHPLRVAEVFMDVGFLIRRDPDRIVCPDVGLADRSVIDTQDTSRTVHAPPLLAVEVVSPNHRSREVASKVQEYLVAGSRRVWVANPRSKTVTVHFPDRASRTLGIDQALTSDDAGFLVEGFTLPVASIFEQP